MPMDKVEGEGCSQGESAGAVAGERCYAIARSAQCA